MTKLFKGLVQLGQLEQGSFVLVIVGALLPLLALAVVGLYAAIVEGYWTALMIVLLLGSLLIWLPFWVRWKHHKKMVMDEGLLVEDDALLVKPSSEWVEFDQKIWEQIQQRVLVEVNAQTQWQVLEPLGHEIVEQIARYYFPDSSDPLREFSAPEFLLMLEELSRRYRQLLHTHVPYVEKIHVAQILKGYRNLDKMVYVKRFYDVYRMLRLLTPEGMLAEARGQVMGQLFDRVNSNVQLQLKRAIMQDLASVAIDLYSGRFRVSDRELSQQSELQNERDLTAPEVEPLRIVLVGQVSAGKSSLINSLMGKVAAETSVVPTQQGIEIHHCKREGVELLRLVDLPGLDGQQETEDLIFQQMVNSDLILWVLPAHRPARDLDIKLKKRFDQYYEQAANVMRRRPKIVALINQIDRLPPVQEWSPPYDLMNPSGKKAQVIAEALEYNRELLQSDEVLPVAVPQGKQEFQISELIEVIQRAYADAVSTQLNRRRLEAADVSVQKQLQRALQLGKGLWDLLDLESIRPNG